MTRVKKCTVAGRSATGYRFGMQLGPFQVTLVDVLIVSNAVATVSNAVATCMLGWQSRKAKLDRAESEWSGKKTIVAPAWHAPRTSTPGQRLAHLVHTAADFRVEADD